MKVTIFLLGLVFFSHAAPQPKQFHDHFLDFLDIIREEVDVEHLMEHYLEFEEFRTSLLYLTTNNFRDLVDEMEHLPEFVAVVQFLENDNIDISYFIDIFNGVLESFQLDFKRARHTLSGTDLNSYIRDITAAFPRERLAALFDEKMANEEDFSTAITNLQSEEWDQIFRAFWNSEAFQQEKQILADNGLDLDLVLVEIKAVFGQ